MFGLKRKEKEYTSLNLIVLFVLLFLLLCYQPNSFYTEKMEVNNDKRRKKEIV